MKHQGKVAVGLGYDQQVDMAPQVLFCCQDSLVDTIVELARKYGVPVVEEVSLVSNLSKIPPGKEIPTKLYNQVASLFQKLPK